MYLEYTKELSGDAFARLKLAINERDEFWANNNLTEDEAKAVNRLLDGKMLLFENHRLLLELAARTPKLWKSGKNISI
jgi:hypothetical protein